MTVKPHLASRSSPDPQVRTTSAWFGWNHYLSQQPPFRRTYRYTGMEEHEALARWRRWVHVEYGSRFYLSVVSVVCFAFIDIIFKVR